KRREKKRGRTASEEQGASGRAVGQVEGVQQLGAPARLQVSWGEALQIRDEALDAGATEGARRGDALAAGHVDDHLFEHGADARRRAEGDGGVAVHRTAARGALVGDRPVLWDPFGAARLA